MPILQVRHYKSLPELRRVLSSLMRSVASDNATLANIKRAINSRAVAVTAAPISRKAKSGNAPIQSLTLRGGAGAKRGAAKVDVPSLNTKTAEKLSSLLEDRGDKLRIAEHIRQLLRHTFSPDDANAQRMLKLADKLVTDSQAMREETQRMLDALGSKHTTPQFKAIVDALYQRLEDTFEGRFKSFKKQLSVTTGTHNGEPATFYIAYLIFDDLEGRVATQDYVIVVTQVIGMGARSEEVSGRGKSKTVDRATAQNYVRTLTDYRPPNWIVKHGLGVPFGSNVDAAANAILVTMRSEDMLDAIEGTGVPIKQRQLKFDEKLVREVKVDDENDKLSVYLAPSIKTAEQAKAASAQVFLQLKQLIAAVHPRYRNPTKMHTPVRIAATVKVKGKSVKAEMYRIDFTFSKPEQEATSVPRDKLKEFMKLLDIPNQDTAREFLGHMKTFLGFR